MFNWFKNKSSPECWLLKCVNIRKKAKLEKMTLKELEEVLDKCNECSDKFRNISRVQETRNTVWAKYVELFSKSFIK